MSPRVRSTGVAVCATALLALAPADASAQALARSWTVAGCDDSWSEVLGPGPRLCGTARLELWTFGFPVGAPYAWTGELRVRDFVLDGRTGFVGYVSAQGQYRFTYTGGSMSAQDLGDTGFGRCFQVVCRGLVPEFGASILTTGSIDVQAMMVNVRYVSNDVPTGFNTWGPNEPTYYASRLVMQTIPEPSTVLTTGLGLAAVALGGWGRARRR